MNKAIVSLRSVRLEAISKRSGHWLTTHNMYSSMTCTRLRAEREKGWSHWLCINHVSEAAHAWCKFASIAYNWVKQMEVCQTLRAFPTSLWIPSVWISLSLSPSYRFIHGTNRNRHCFCLPLLWQQLQKYNVIASLTGHICTTLDLI